MNTYNIYLFGVYGADGNLRAVKIGQTARAVEVRRAEVQKHANESACAYNKGAHIVLAYVTAQGYNAGPIMEAVIHGLMVQRHSTIYRFKHSKDYFGFKRKFSEKTLIQWFYECATQAAFNNYLTCSKGL